MPGETPKVRIIVGITGASGSIYGWRLLEKLHQHPDCEVHFVLSRSGERTAFLELGKTAADFRGLAHCSYPPEDIGCRLASGSFQTAGMVIAPCSINTMSAISCGVSGNLMVRAADVILKERRKLILMVRESPLHLGHLRSMTALAEMGAILAPPGPGFLPASIQRRGTGGSQRRPRIGPAGLAVRGDVSLGRGESRAGACAQQAKDAQRGKRMRVAFQGELGAFSQQAIRQFLGASARPVPCPLFDQVFTALAAKRADAAAIPIENTLHGSIHENYDLLIKHDFIITAETNVRIVHNLIAPPGMTFRQVRRVFSKDVALNQCRDFFAQHPSIRARDLLRHRGQRQNDHGREACGRRGHRLRPGRENLRSPYFEARN